MKNIIKLFIHLFLLRPFVKIFFGINVDGKENIYKLNRYIIIANHNSHLDILLLFYFLPIKHILKTHPVGAKEYFSKSKIVYYIINYLFSPIWITRDSIKMQRDPLKEIKNKLDDMHNIIIFPEGTRGNAGKIQPFKSGIGRLSEQYKNIPIVPVFLFGPERALPKKQLLPVPIWINLIIGPPQLFRDTHTEIKHSLEKIIIELSEAAIEHRHKRISIKSKTVLSIAFLGIDGSGKSTISHNITKQLSQKSNAALISDALELYENSTKKEIQPLFTEKFRRMIGKYAKKAKSLKLYKLPKLTELFLRDIILNDIKRWYNPQYIVHDGSPLLNLIAWSIIYKEESFNECVCLKAIKILTAKDEQIKRDDPIYKNYPELLSIKRLGLNHLKLQDIVIFIDTPVDIAIDRIEQRGQNRQVHETKEKLENLRKAYQIVCNVIRDNINIPMYIINGDDTIDNITHLVISFIHKQIIKEQTYV